MLTEVCGALERANMSPGEELHMGSVMAGKAVDRLELGGQSPQTGLFAVLFLSLFGLARTAFGRFSSPH